MANINETPLDRYLRKTGKIGDGNLSSKLSTTPIKKPTNKGGLLGGIGYTFEQLGLGVVRGVEGLSDFLVGGVADIFGADDFADEIMKSDWINYEHANEWYNPNKAMSVVGDIGQGVGAMLPSIGAAAAITYFSGGTAAPVAAKIVGGTMLGTQAAGQATSQATKESGTAGGKEWLYGIGSGIAEAAVEGISGGIGGKAAGTLLGKQVAKSTAGKLAMSAVGEGLEEVAGDYIDVGLRRATGVEKDAKLPTAKELGKTFIVGAGVGGVLGGAGRATNAIKAGGFNNLNASENAQELTDRLTENNLRQAKGKTARYTPKDMQDTARRLSNNLQKMDAQKRKAYMDSNPFMKAYFAEDGTLLGSVGVSSSTEVNGGLSTYSASLRGREDTLAYAPSQNATETSQRAMDTVTKLTGGKAEVVLTDHDFGATKNGKKINGEYRNGVIYLSATATDADKVNFVAHHEMAHTLEGTKEYGVLGDYIAEMIEKNPTKYAKYNLDAYKERYSQSQTEELSAETKEYEAITEIYADFIANEILSSQESVNRLANRDANIVKKFLSWVRTAIKNIGMSKEERVAYKELRRMEKLLANALDAGKGGVTLAEIEKGQRARKEAIEGVQQEPTGEFATARASLTGKVDKALQDQKNRITPSARFSLEFSKEIATNQTKTNKEMGFVVDETILKQGIESTARMVDMLSQHKDILPEDKIGKVLKSNSSYDKSVENTTICVRTLSYNEFIDMVQEKVGRPLTQAESFLASQKLYEIAVEPQCLYCYVSLDRKAYNEFLLRYIKERDEVIEAYKKSDKTKSTVEKLYEKYRNGRKSTEPLRKRFDMFIEMARKGINPLTASDISTKAKQSEIAARNDYTSVQWKDMAAYAQSASWAKKQVEYAAYYNDILKLSQQAVNNLNKHYGLRFYSFSDYTAAFIVENMQQVTDAAIRGLKGLGYTKDTDFAKIFAPTGMNINISMYAHKNAKTGEWEIDARQSADLQEAIDLRKKYPNVGIVVTASTDEGVLWALQQEWSDIVIPFHIVRTGADVAEFYKWQNYTNESGDTIADEKLWNAYVNGRKKVSKNIYPAEHQNNKDTYFKLIKERGLKPRFERFADNPNYMKLVNETRRSAKDTPAMQPIFDVDAAEKSFNKFVGKGGYFKGWYKQGVNVDAEAKAVAEDVKAGKKANEVNYGRQDINPEDLIKKRKAVRTHKGESRLSIDMDDISDFDAITFSKWFDELTIEELQELIGEDSKAEIETIESLPTKEERRAAYIERMYKQGNLNEAITKIVKKHPQMQAYFKNTKMNQKYNPLYRTKDDEFIVMFHGTPTMFNVFDTKKIGKHGTVMGSGLYFTESLRYAEDYKGDEGRVMATLLNIEKPLSRSKITMTKEDLKRFIREIVDTDGEDFLSNYGDVYSLGYEKLLDKTVNKLYGYHTNDADMIEDIYITSRMDFDEFHNGLTDKLGYDGIIAWNKAEGTQAVAFRSNQVKDIFNFKPTKSEDIRYSIDEEKIAGIRRVTEEKEKKNLQERWQAVKQRTAEGNIASQIAFTNVQAGIEAAGERLGVDLKGKVQKARGATAAALNMIVNEQRDYTGKKSVGKSIKAIFEPIFAKGDDYTVDFYEYLLHKHNVDRMSLEGNAQLEMRNLVANDAELAKIIKDTNLDETAQKELLKKTENGRKYLKLLDVKNKPVFGESVTATESRSRIAELQLKHPEFVEKSKEVWDYNHNLLQRRVDAGLITQEMADDLNKKYPHYVPTFRDVEGLPKQGKAGTKNTKYSVEVKKTIKTATGSNLDILDISVMMSNQTQAVLRAEAINDLAGALYDAAVAKGDFTDVGVINEKDLEEVRAESEDGDIDYAKSVPKNNEVIFYRDGKQITMAVSQPVFVGFESFNGTVPFNSPLVSVVEKINDLFKKGVTTWNPLFLIRNAVRDFQEAIFYTKNGIGKYIANLPRAIKIMAQKGDLWQQYLAIGGHQSGYFNNETGIYDARGKTRKGLAKISEKMSALNEFIEQIPRFNEFMLSLESGKSIEDALLDSADVTTNFSRGGKLTKAFNRTLMPFLNPSVQGFSKLWRTITGRKTARQWGAFVVKALAFGLSVGLINDLLNGDDEDYKNLNTRDKENYFVLGIGDGKFIKIPKGRVVAAFGSIASRTKALLEGDEKAFEGWGSSVAQMVTPADQVTRTIFSPFTDAKTNTTWYGTNIESQSLQNYAVKDRYDEGTSSIAIWIGQTLNISPKKVHYVIDQYSGVIGDIILPATTKKAERDMFSSAFTIDGVTSNRISTDFYDMKDEMMYAKNSGDLIADLVYSYLNRVSSEASEMYKEKREIQGGKLSDKEKLEQAKVVQATINATLQGAMLNAEKLEQILIDMNYEETVISLTKNKTYLNMDEETKTKTAKALKDYTYAKALSELTGEKCEKKYYLFDSIGANATAVYLTEISKIESDKDKDGKTIANSRKEKVHKYIEHLKLSKEQKYILMYLAGYTPTEEGKKYVENYLRKNSFTAKELENLWE